tara:strand:+ start:1752 stop:2141 length:390 start_codon:yes stop_codon:yes gene_type:complete
MVNSFKNEKLINNIIRNIDNIYENLNIYRAFFVIMPELQNDIYQKLIDKDYPVTTLDNEEKLINNESRILLINNLDINKVHNNYKLFDSLSTVNLIVFIETPRIYDRYFYRNLFNIKNLYDKNINIFQL